jgi:hypothetical protein
LCVPAIESVEAAFHPAKLRSDGITLVARDLPAAQDKIVERWRLRDGMFEVKPIP